VVEGEFRAVAVPRAVPGAAPDSQAQPDRSDLLTVSGLTVRYGDAVALENLDLAVRRNELFVLLGASGSGKTTLLRALAGFVRPDAGHIVLNGKDMTTLPPHRRPVNTMFQSYALFPHMSVAANIGFGLRQQGVSRVETNQRVEAMLALVRLQGYGSRRPSELSGGQQQRVALARSRAPHRVLLLLDEPLSALDEALRMETRAELVRLRRELGISFVLVTHDQDEALEMADRLGVMQGGRMVQIGTPADLYEHPANRFVASFLGGANLLPASLPPMAFPSACPPLAFPSKPNGRGVRDRGCWRCGRNGCAWMTGVPSTGSRAWSPAAPMPATRCRWRSGCPMGVWCGRNNHSQTAWPPPGRNPARRCAWAGSPTRASCCRNDARRPAFWPLVMAGYSIVMAAHPILRAGYPGVMAGRVPHRR